MALDFRKPTLTAAKTSTAKEDRPKAEFWLNVGYSVDVETDEGVEQRFISLPMGLPLDQQEKLSTNSSNDMFAAMQSARNDLLEQLMEAASKLSPGEDTIVNLQVQVRRVQGERVAIPAGQNPFVRKLSL